LVHRASAASSATSDVRERGVPRQLGPDPGEQQALAVDGEQQTEGAAGEGQDQALEEQLGDEASSAGAEGEAAPGRRPRRPTLAR
jgi:hypothetical protein